MSFSHLFMQTKGFNNQGRIEVLVKDLLDLCGIGTLVVSVAEVITKAQLFPLREVQDSN